MAKNQKGPYNASQYRWSASVIVDGSYTVINGILASTRDSARMQAAKQAGVEVRYVISVSN